MSRKLGSTEEDLRFKVLESGWAILQVASQVIQACPLELSQLTVGPCKDEFKGSDLKLKFESLIESTLFY